LTVFNGKKGCDWKNGMRRKRGEKAECGGWSAVGGYGRDYGTDRGLVAGDERKASKAMFGGAIMK